MCVVSTKVHNFNQICNDGGESDFCLASSFISVNDVCHRSRNGIHVSLLLLEIISLCFFFIFELFTMLSLAKYAKCFHIATSILNNCPNDRFRMMSNRFQLTDLSLCEFFSATLRNRHRDTDAMCTTHFFI